MNEEIAILGAGFSSLSAASYLAKAGYDVTIYEKNGQVGGRANQYRKDGFLFDMGPTWYWMPDVFDRFFNDFDRSTKEFYELKRLDPAYQVYFGENDSVKISARLEEIYTLFEKEEKGSSVQLKKFLNQAEKNYNVAVKDIVYRPGVSPLELISYKTITKLNQMFFSIRKQIQKKFNNPRLTKILEFPVLFLGAKPGNTPAMYNFMNWADFGLGTWHPMGGMYEVAAGMERLAIELGVEIKYNSPAEKINVDENGRVKSLIVNREEIKADIILSGADYFHTEQLLEPKYRQYSDEYWSKKTFAPSSLLFYVGFDKKLENVSHHTLFFDEEFDKHAEDIYDNPKWPKDPLFYASFASKSDTAFAPEGKEAATFLIPIAAGLEDNEAFRAKYFDIIMTRLENLTNQKLKDHVLFSKSYCVNDFVEDYNSFKGNAYGLANILTQTAFLRPKIKSKKVKNLFFTGQLTVPGPGVPPALISGKLAADLIIKNSYHEAIIR
ncbi:phytoene desaturase family protein [Crocinitomix catalasitica]|uniref:phytoene desaturase family protein n=1 Tax=Crocinitomix catalasitica TaxID=184607 RepID=UPI000482056B|nr:phytoene desaturase family protein [Crocinitomix catalasitica]